MIEQKVSVIICAYTEERYADTVDAINSVLNQSLPPYEVIVSIDHNKQLAERLRQEVSSNVKIVINENIRGLSETRNVGIKNSSGDIVAFLDDDAEAEPDWLEKLVVLFDDPDVISTGGRAILQWIGGRPFWFPEELDWIVGGGYIGMPTQKAIVRNVHGSNMCFRRKVFTESGYFSAEIGGIGTTYRSGEEADVCLRAFRKWPSSKVIFEPGAVVRHKTQHYKAKFRIVVKRAYNEGIYKSRLEKTAKTDGSHEPLSTEHSYLSHLIFRAIPSRLIRFWQPGKYIEAAVIIVCVSATGLGYTVGKFRWR